MGSAEAIYYGAICFESLDLIISSMKDRLEDNGRYYDVCCKIQNLLLSAAKGHAVEDSVTTSSVLSISLVMI